MTKSDENDESKQFASPPCFLHELDPEFDWPAFRHPDRATPMARIACIPPRQKKEF